MKTKTWTMVSTVLVLTFPSYAGATEREEGASVSDPLRMEGEDPVMGEPNPDDAPNADRYGAPESGAAATSPAATVQEVEVETDVTPMDPSDPRVRPPIVESEYGEVRAETGEMYERDVSGFEGAIRVAYGIPMGGLTDDQDLNDLIGGSLPLQLDLGYRFNEHLFAGFYGSYAFGFEGDSCGKLGVECSDLGQTRVGLEVLFHIVPVTEQFSPYIGGGVGYEWLWVTTDTPGPIDPNSRIVNEGTAGGLEYFNAQLGVDFLVADHMRFGPYALFSMGQYSNFSNTIDGVDVDFEPDEDTHQWLHLGLKGTYGAF